MKKIVYQIICSLLAFTLLIGTVAFAKTKENKNNNADPYAAFHNEVNTKMQNIRVEKYNEMALIDQQIIDLKKNSEALLNHINEDIHRTANSEETEAITDLQSSDAMLNQNDLDINHTHSLKEAETISNLQAQYDVIVSQIDSFENKKMQVKNQMYSEVDQTLKDLGFVKASTEIQSDEIDENIALQETEPGYMQTKSDAYYYSQTKEFYYWVDYDYTETNIFGVKSGLDDIWGDYDLVSMQHKDDNGWNWNNITVDAYMVYRNSLAGSADKYHIISGTAVSNRDDFWNGCIFNVKDENPSPDINFCIVKISLNGWLQTRGSSRSTQVKSEYEHNYKAWVFSSVQIESTGLNQSEFKMNVTYSKESKIWRRSAGSRVVQIPNGC